MGIGGARRIDRAGQIGPAPRIGRGGKTAKDLHPEPEAQYDPSRNWKDAKEDDEDDKDFDIWYCDWDDDLGEWKKAKNLGPDVNTPAMEMSPFIAPDGRTLFFSSNGHLPNMGGLDFYRTKKTGEKDKEGRDRWAKPEQLPAPINSPEKDAFLSMPPSGDVLYFSSEREDIKGAKGEYDIYMAFIPTFTRAVNLIVTVVDECTGQNVPATITYKNAITSRESKGEVTTSNIESNIIVGDDDYGTGKSKAGSVNITVTASSETYGQRSITVPVQYPGLTTNKDEANAQTEIRKTITLGSRPTLAADMELSDWAKKKNNNFKGLVIEERATIQLFPLLPYVFFDLNSSTLPARYKRLTSAQTNDFTDERLPGGTLDKYYHTLNIFGYRLRKFPNVNVEVVGCTDENNEDKNSPLPKQRAQVVYDYLKNVWGIPESRMKLTARGWPELPSNKKDSNGIVENRRTELVFSGSKDDLWRATVDSLFERMRSDLDQAVPGSPDEAVQDPVAVFSDVIRRHVHHTAKHPELSRIMLMETAKKSERVDWLLRNHVRPTLAALDLVWTDVTAMGHGRNLPAEEVFMLMIGLAPTPFAQAGLMHPLLGVARCTPDRHAESMIEWILG